MEALRRVCQASGEAVNTTAHAVYSREYEAQLAGAVQDALAAAGADPAAIYALVTESVRRDVDYTPPAVHNALLQVLHPDTVIDPAKGTTVLHELMSRAYPPQLVGGYGGGEEEAGEDGSACGEAAAAAATAAEEGAAPTAGAGAGAAEAAAAGARAAEAPTAGGAAGDEERPAAVAAGAAGAAAEAAEASKGRSALEAATTTAGTRAAASAALAAAVNAAIHDGTSAVAAAATATGGTPAAAAVQAAAGGSSREEGEGAGGGSAGCGISLLQFLARGATPDLLDAGGNSALHLLLAGVASETMFPDATGAMASQVRDMKVEDMFGDADRVHYLDTVGRALLQAGWSLGLPNRKGNTCAKLLQLCRSRLESKGARMVQHAGAMLGSEAAQRLQQQLAHTRAVLDQLEACGSDS